MAGGDLSDEEWRIIEPLLPTERGRKSRPSHDNRRCFNGMLHVLRFGCPWVSVVPGTPRLDQDGFEGSRASHDVDRNYAPKGADSRCYLRSM
ncbi:transposase [Rhizobium indigoferae]|uniref:Transposase n=1 Tax=Rhizobium indigoferae TaxID=158891 RepID=A0ABZ0ZAG8_9HYPH|nr:transposase [Rhizobium indigoferae]WQN35413.1 transposase [Rhizobium indigoferae]